MSKSFVAATVLLLRDEGVLRLDDLVERWVPQLKGLPLATADSPKPTLRHLLSVRQRAHRPSTLLRSVYTVRQRVHCPSTLPLRMGVLLRLCCAGCR